jgi:uncharacterized protein involved in response to NO
LVALAFGGVVAREILAGKNWRNLPVIGALSLLFAGKPNSAIASE